MSLTGQTPGLVRDHDASEAGLGAAPDLPVRPAGSPVIALAAQKVGQPQWADIEDLVTVQR